MKNATELLKNLVPGAEYLKATIKEGVTALKPYAKELEVIHIKIDYPMHPPGERKNITIF